MDAIIDAEQTLKNESLEKTQWDQDFLERHHLAGHIYRRTQNKTYYPYWKSQLTRNSFAKGELERIGEDLKKDHIQVYLLKGYSLMGEIYQDWGERYVSDIDLLVTHDELWKLTDILKMHGYQKKKQARWLGNRHKHVYTKQEQDLSLSIEINTQLFWHTSLNINEPKEASQVSGFFKLSIEHQLIHLCGHLACQHSYSKLFWLMDIFKFVERYKDKMNWKSFWQRAEKANLYKACFFTLFLCQKLGLNIQTVFYRAPKKKKIGIFILKKIVNFSFLYRPENFVFRSYLVKLLVRDSFLDNIRYGFAWLKTFKVRGFLSL